MIWDGAAGSLEVDGDSSLAVLLNFLHFVFPHDRIMKVLGQGYLFFPILDIQLLPPQPNGQKFLFYQFLF